jgi:hypothetical protein
MRSDRASRRESTAWERTRPHRVHGVHVADRDDAPGRAFSGVPSATAVNLDVVVEVKVNDNVNWRGGFALTSRSKRLTRRRYNG